MPEAPRTLYFLQASRAIRVAWTLHELDLPYENVFFDRVKEKAPPALKEVSGNPLGKSPTLNDDGLIIQESGAICEYLAQKYDISGRLIGGNDDKQRVKILEWIHAAEGTFMIHGLAVLYARWACPPEALAATEKFLSNNVLKDLDWLDGELKESSSGWLVGDQLSLADIMMQFSVEFIFERKLGLRTEEGKRDVDGERWKHVKAWMEKCGQTGSYKDSVAKTGYTLRPETGVNWRMHL